jgi:hypothetical protein
MHLKQLQQTIFLVQRCHSMCRGCGPLGEKYSTALLVSETTLYRRLGSSPPGDESRFLSCSGGQETPCIFPSAPTSSRSGGIERLFDPSTTRPASTAPNNLVRMRSAEAEAHRPQQPGLASRSRGRSTPTEGAGEGDVERRAGMEVTAIVSHAEHAAAASAAAASAARSYHSSISSGNSSYMTRNAPRAPSRARVVPRAIERRAEVHAGEGTRAPCRLGRATLPLPRLRRHCCGGPAAWCQRRR